MRTLSLLSLLLAAGCQQDPAGQCDVHADCAAGRQCSDGVCVALVTTGEVGARCVRESDCREWADCAAEVCALTAGRCTPTAGCASWQACGSDHYCGTAAGHCATGADCEEWETCGGVDHLCALTAGRCTATAGCDASWQTCTIDHLCNTTPGHCATGADCEEWETCAGNVCALAAGRCTKVSDCAVTEVCNGTSNCVAAPPGPFVPSEVLLFGTLPPAPRAVARPGAPEIPYAGLGAFSGMNDAFVSPAGEIVYRQHPLDSGDRERLRVFRVDAIAWDAAQAVWRPPSDPFGNDSEIPTPACAAAGLNHVAMQGGTGEILYSCAGGTTYFDTTGATVLTGYDELLSWNANGTMLATKTVAGSPVWDHRDALGAAVPLSDFSPSTQYPVAARTAGGGFRLVAVDAANAYSRWTVDAAGVATKDGDYAAPAGHDLWCIRLDAAGDAFVDATLTGGSVHEVYRCPVGGPCTLVYDEATAPLVDWWTTDPATFFLHAGGADSLVTGP